jgi:ribosomal-protein-alanine N-acetyltransferase
MIETKRLLIRKLDPEVDDFTNYLSWMKDVELNRYIESVRISISAQDIHGYVETKNASPNTLLLGIFMKNSGEHIGNIKFEPLVTGRDPTWVGLLIGNVKMRGLGIGHEAMKESITYLRNTNGSKVFNLGVNAENYAAISLYKKLGFVNVSTADPADRKTLIMSLTLP